MSDEFELSSSSALQSKHSLCSVTPTPNELEVLREVLHKTQLALQQEREVSALHQTELMVVKTTLVAEKQRVKKLWREHCDQLVAHEELQDKKDDEIHAFKAELTALRTPHGLVVEDTIVHACCRPELYEILADLTPSSRPISETTGSTDERVGKAPPVDIFTGESPAILWEDWIPTFNRAAQWNQWTEEEILMQLPGYSGISY